MTPGRESQGPKSQTLLQVRVGSLFCGVSLFALTIIKNDDLSSIGRCHTFLLATTQNDYQSTTTIQDTT
jgi:hypothetical protein